MALRLAKKKVMKKPQEEEEKKKKKDDHERYIKKADWLGSGMLVMYNFLEDSFCNKPLISKRVFRVGKRRKLFFSFFTRGLMRDIGRVD